MNLPVTSDGVDPWSLAAADADRICDRLGEPTAAVVLGSGWAGVGAALGEPVEQMPISDLAGATAPAVSGHGQTATMVNVDGAPVLVLAGRTHLYEGHPAHRVVHLVRSAALAGSRSVLLTNAAGALHDRIAVGTPVVLSDQLNLTGANPMVGPPPPEHLPGRFVDLGGLYSRRLRATALAADPNALEGVYAGVLGGSYETPAEIQMLARMGADVVGMSTVLEAIAAHHLGAEVFGVALVTNLGAGLQASVDHGEVLATGAAAGPRLAALLRAVLAEAAVRSG